MVAQVRRFNRRYTQRVGALEDAVPRPRPAARRGPGAVGDRRRRAGRQGAAPAARPRLGLPQPAAPLVGGDGARHRRAEHGRPARAHRSPDGGGSGRAGGARPAQRRAGGLGPRTAVVAPARAAGAGAGRGRAPAGRRPRGHRGDRPRPAGGAVVPAGLLRRARPPVRHRLRSGAGPADRGGRHAAAGGRVPRRHPAGRARGVRRPQVPPRRGGRAQAPVGRRLGPGPRGRAAAGRPGWRSTPRPTARPWSGSTRTRPSPRPSPSTRASGTARSGVQRRGLRRPLVREAPGRFPRESVAGATDPAGEIAVAGE